jgi:hypothetical protein
LDPNLVEKHANLINSSLKSQAKPEFKINDTCRPDNGGILQCSELKLCMESSIASRNVSDFGGYIGFVPAAGAASRYSLPFTPIIQLLEQRISREFQDQDFQILFELLQKVAATGAVNWAIPSSLKALLTASKNELLSLTSSQCKEIVSELYLPKALYPCVQEQFSFLEFKDLEHRMNPYLDGQVFVTPPAMSRVFEMHLQHSELGAVVQTKKQDRLQTLFVEQGPKLSTIRFKPDGSPFLDSNDQLTVVPAGHGALAELFTNIGHHFPNSDSLLIRNIDNLNGISADVLNGTKEFIEIHRFILNRLKKIRGSLRKGQVQEAASHSEPLKKLLSKNAPQFVVKGLAQLDKYSTSPEHELWTILLGVFHTPLPHLLNLENLTQAYERPFNLMGQVPNSQNDVGGTPCFVLHNQNVQKLCIEVPHVSDQDQDLFLRNPVKATHFNPVFVAAEIPEEDHYYSNRNDDFWLLAEKSYKGQKVLYVETVLYELLGNSELANCIFVELPRLLFHPHKTPQDSAFKTVSSWIQSQDP